MRILGDWNAISNRWPQAIKRFTSLTRLYPTDQLGTSLDHFRLGTALLESGNRDDYERFRQQIVSGFGRAESTTNSLPDRLILPCLLLPANQQLLQNLKPLAEAAEKALSDPDRTTPPAEYTLRRLTAPGMSTRTSRITSLHAKMSRYSDLLVWEKPISSKARSICWF